MQRATTGSGGEETSLCGRHGVLTALQDVLPLASVLAKTLVLIGLGGHRPAGPELEQLTLLVTSSFRHDDWLGLPAPDEVAVILSGTSDDAQSAAVRVLGLIDETGTGLPVAIGIVVLSAELTAEEALSRATDAVTVARVLGRRRIVHDTTPSAGTPPLDTVPPRPAGPPAGNHSAARPWPAGADRRRPGASGGRAAGGAW